MSTKSLCQVLRKLSSVLSIFVQSLAKILQPSLEISQVPKLAQIWDKLQLTQMELQVYSINFFKNLQPLRLRIFVKIFLMNCKFSKKNYQKQLIIESMNDAKIEQVIKTTKITIVSNFDSIQKIHFKFNSSTIKQKYASFQIICNTLHHYIFFNKKKNFSRLNKDIYN